MSPPKFMWKQERAGLLRTFIKYLLEYNDCFFLTQINLLYYHWYVFITYFTLYPWRFAQDCPILNKLEFSSPYRIVLPILPPTIWSFLTHYSERHSFERHNKVSIVIRVNVWLDLNEFLSSCSWETTFPNNLQVRSYFVIFFVISTTKKGWEIMMLF